MNTSAPNTQQSLLSQARTKSISVLKDFTSQADFIDRLRVAFGSTFDESIALGIASELQSGHLSAIPEIQVLSGGELGTANGAYAAALDRIFVSADFLAQHVSDIDAIAELLLEEIGHKFDQLLNGGVDSAGDEGAIFRLLVTGQSLSAENLAGLRAIDDSAVINVAGRSLIVERQDIFGTPGNDSITGGSGNDSITAGDGNDTISGGGGNDTINAGAGDDTINVGSSFGGGADVIDGGEGRDFIQLTDGSGIGAGITINYQDVSNGTIVGSTFSSNGTTFKNIERFRINITPSGGSDIIDVSAATGDTYIDASHGNNRVVGGSGADNIDARDGNDTVIGGAGSDRLFSWLGDDSVSGDAGNDSIDGGEGNNTLNGGAGDDTIIAGAGNDVINGGDGSDIISAGAGNDIIDAGAGNDAINASIGTDFYDGGTGYDFLTLTDSSNAAVTINYQAVNAGTITGGINSSGSIRNIERFTITTGSGSDNINISAAASDFAVNTLAYVNHINIINAGDGNNTVTTTTDKDNISTGIGNDTINAGGGDDNINAGNGDNNIAGGAGNDTIVAGTGNDTVNGGDGDDSINVGTGANVIDGGAGYEFWAISDTTNSTVTIDYQTVGSGTITGGANSGSTFKNIEGLNITTGSGNDIVNVSAARSAVVNAGNGNNTITSTMGADNINAGIGDDNISSGAGDDNINAGTGVDTIDGGLGNDFLTINEFAAASTISYQSISNGTVSGGSNNGTTFQNIEGLNIATSANNDNINISAAISNSTVNAGNGNNIVTSGMGNDSIATGTGNDAINGGAGNDTIVAGTGVDTINGGSGDDLLTINDATGAAVTLDYQNINNGTISGGSSDGTTFQNIEQLTITTGAGSDSINIVAATIGGRISTGNGNNNVIGGLGNDTIIAGSGNDTIDGGAGNDLIFLGNGNFFGFSSGNFVSINYSNTGIDSINGGSGNDTLEIIDNSNVAVTIDYQSNVNGTIMGGLSSGTTFQNIERFNVTTGTGNDSINIAATTVGSRISAGNGNNTIVSGSGNDTISAGNGNDTISTGAGNDIIESSTGADIIDGGSGSDSWKTFDAAVTTAITIDYQSAISGTVSGGINNSTTFRNIEVLDITTGTGNDNINVSANTVERTTINAGAGDNTILGSAGSDTITTGTGNDTINGGAGNDFINAGDGNNIVNGGTGNDDLSAGIGNDSIDGGIGNDRLTIGKGTDTLDGGAGEDALSLFDSSSTAAVTIAYTAPATVGTVTSTSGYNTTFQDIERFTVTTGAGNDNIDISAAAGNSTINVGSGDDTVIAGIGNDSITAGVGNDSISGGAGIDTLNINDNSGIALTINYTNPASNGTVIGGAGLNINFQSIEQFSIGTGTGDQNINISAATGNSSIYTSSGNDTIMAGAGSDQIGAGDGNNIIVAGAGDDRITAGLGNDSINAGLGDDNITLSLGNDTIDGGVGGIDYLVIDASTSLSSVTINHQGTAGATGTIAGGNGFNTTFQNIERFDIRTGAGDDSIDVSASNTQGYFGYIYAGEGNNLVINGAANRTITAGMGNDTIYGGSYDDFINAGSGNNLIASGAGNDSITTYQGNDQIDGGNGDDSINAGTGVDTINGGNGNDSLTIVDSSQSAITINYQNVTNGTITGGDNNGTVFQNIEGLNLTTGSGHDTINVSATTQNNSISTGGGNDMIVSGAGNDVIYAGTGNDSIDAGMGIDSLVIYDASAIALNVDYQVLANGGTVAGGAGFNTTFQNFEILQVSSGAGSDNVNVSALVSSTSISTGSGNDIITTGTGDDVIDAGSGADIINGGAGTDFLSFSDTSSAAKTISYQVAANGGTIAGGASDGTTFQNIEQFNITTGSGNDNIDISGATGLTPLRFIYGNRIATGAGNDTIVSGIGSEIINGGAGDDSINSGAGTDEITIGTGNDTINGGADEDMIIIDHSFDGSIFAESVTINYTDSASIGTINTSYGVNTTFQNIERFTIRTYFGSNSINISAATGDSIVSTASRFFMHPPGDDTVITGAGNDYIFTDKGNDIVDGGAGIDTLEISDERSESAMNVSYQSISSGTAIGGTSHNIAFQNIEKLSLYTGSGNDNIDVSATTDGSNIGSGAGNDTILGGTGNDTIGAGIGNDTVDGNTGIDKLSISEYSGTAIAINYVNAANNGTVTGINGYNTVFQSIEAFQIDVGAGDDVIKVSAAIGDGYIRSGAGNDLIESGSGNDSLDGSAGNDTIISGDGNDTVTGGAGDDTIIGGVGIVTATFSGKFADYTFAYNSSTGTYTVSDNRLGTPDGTDILNNIDYFQFTDRTVANPSGNSSLVNIEQAGNIQLVQLDGSYAAVDATTNLSTPVTYGGNLITPNTFPGWSVIAAERIGDTPTGEIEYMWKNNSGQFWYSTNTNNGSYVSANAIFQKELDFQQDFNGDSVLGAIPITVESAGTTSLRVNSVGQYLASNNGTDINLQYAGQTVGPGSFEGWLVIGAEIAGTDVKQVWKSSSGQFWYSTNTDNGYYLSANAIFQKELEFQQDFNNDNNIGAVTSSIESSGTTILKVDANGQYVADNGSTNINLQYNGQNIGPDYFAGWSVVGAEIDGTDVKQMWKSNNGLFWYSSNTDNGGLVNATSFESMFQQDFDGDSLITSQGTNGNDILASAVSNQRLVGLTEDDTYTFDTTIAQGADIIVEAVGEGEDTIVFTGNTAINIDLSITNAQIINGNVTLTVANIENIVGGAGDDTISGSVADNTFTGGTGNDTFFFGNVAVNNLSIMGIDTIIDFAPGSDKLQLSKSVFTSLATIPSNELSAMDFTTITTGMTADVSDAFIVYNSTTGDLFYNANGNAPGLGTNGSQFARLSGTPTLNHNNIHVVS
jgi:Ca2+-binding RTX toxin-like protein